MKTAKSFLIGCSAALLALPATAQTAGDLLNMSQYNYSFGTARSAALGGAFTSLGADLSSININPAGLGMYRSSDVGITPSVTWNTMESNYLGMNSDYSKTRFGLGNVAAAFNLYQGGGALTSFTLGVGYNKMADFNTSSLARGYGAPNSINEIFAEQLLGVPESTISQPKLKPFEDLPTDMWGGILAYQTGILDPVKGSDPQAYSPWNAIAEDAAINPTLRNITKGSIGEYDIAGGFNFGNILYVGFTVGIQDINYNNQNDYSEFYSNNPQPLNGMRYIRSLKMDGTGVNFKFGAVVRPIENLRIGLAVHTPTFIRINEEYIEYMSADYKNQRPGDMLDSRYALNEYNINTPTRLMAGLSYTVPGVGLITADYERVWYNGMRLKNMNSWNYEESVKTDVEDLYRPANNFRVGIEATPLKNFYLRAGYAHYDNCMRGDYAIFNNQAIIKSYDNFSGGLGFRFQNIYVDVAYIYSKYKYNPYDMFYFAEYDASGNQTYLIESGQVSTRQNRNTISLSLGVKF